MKKVDEKQKAVKRSILLAVILIAIIVVLYFVFLQHVYNQCENSFSNTENYVRKRLETYDNYQNNDKTKSLIRLADKTVEAAHRLESVDVADKVSMEKYLQEQHLSGIFAVDKNLNLKYGVKKSETESVAWNELLDSDCVKEIVEFPKKTFAKRVTTSKGTIDVAAAARSDAEGAVIAYVFQDTVKVGINDITLDDVFLNMNFNYDGLVVVASEGKVIAANKDMGYSIPAEKWEKLGASKPVKGERFSKVSFSGKKWYTQKVKCEDYAVYISFPVKTTFQKYFIILIIISLIYTAGCTLIYIAYRTSERKNYMDMEKQYQTISAISEVYVASVLVNVKTGECEWVKCPEELKKSLDISSTSDTMFHDITDKYVEEEFRGKFVEFINMDTIGERMQGNNMISFLYKDVFGAWIEIDIVTQKTDKQGNVEMALYLIRNVTDDIQKEMDYQEQLQKAGDAKISFLRRMSHDIRAPINGILGMVEVGDHYSDDLEKQAECRRKIKDASDILLELINEVVDMGKLESGEIVLDQREFDLKKLTEDCVDLVEKSAKSYNVKIIKEDNIVTHRHLSGSPTHVKRILMNILSNAVKYNKEYGSITLSCRELPSPTTDEAIIEFTCADTGIGMSEEFQEHIFDEFAQEYQGGRTKFAGTGLGMPIAKNLTEKMGGTISFQSVKGKGTTFTIVLPFKICEQEEEKSTAVKEEKSASIAGLKILLVEDNELNMEIAQFILENEGAEITKAWNGREALDAFKNNEAGSFDVILMDIMMPVMDGYEATERIRALERADSKTVPIIAMTANAFVEDRMKTKATGMVAHLAKPLDRETMLFTIAKLAEKNKGRNRENTI